MTFPKKKLLVILGAGSSMPCGMPSVAKLDDKMKEWCREWKPHPNVSFVSGCARWQVYNDLLGMLEEYYRTTEPLSPPMKVNFEKVLGEMIALAYWVTPAPLGNPLTLAVQDAQLSSRFQWSSQPPPDAQYLPQLTIRDQLAYLLGKLAECMRKRSKALNKDAPEFRDYQKILSRLRDEFEVGVYNLNYDNVAISAWPDAFTGFRGGKFDARAVSVRKEWDFIYHLHGSVHYSLASEQRTNILWVDDLTSGDFTDSTSLRQGSAEEFKPLVPTTFIAGTFKLDQLLVDPFQTFYASLIRHAHEADAVLIAGYGFGDVHVNRALQNRLSIPSGSDSPLPPVVVVTKCDASSEPMGIRQNWDIWARRLGETLNATFGNDQPKPRQLVEQNKFEKANSGHVCIWHGGFLEILGCLEQVVAHLHPQSG